MRRGRAALEVLAERYPQLYLVPGTEGAEERYTDAVRRGIFPERNDLSHFYTEEEDSLTTVGTPAGAVEVLTLHRREDFEQFLRIIAYRCREEAIPPTLGASTLDGIINWRTIEAHREAFYAQQRERGISDPDWGAEFRSFTSVKENYCDTLIVLSAGPYSGVSAAEAGFEEGRWLRISGQIRLYHELTHVICRRMYPAQTDAVWDELTADAVGIYAALGRYDRRLEERFLGICGGRYTGGRLCHYVKDPENAEALDRLASRADGVLAAFEKVFEENDGADPFAVIAVLEEKQADLWGAPDRAKFL